MEGKDPWETSYNPKTDFNWLEEMPQCIGHIEDQGDCGSCWAFSSSGLLADRFCIHTDGVFNQRFSPQEMVNCNFENFSCLGGYLTTTLDYLQVDGLVTSECQGYHSQMQSCSYECDTPDVKYGKYYCELSSLKVLTDSESIKNELRENGPMIMGLRIYEDFMNYDQGVYKYTTGDLVGGHAMKLIGFGEDASEGLFWILQNQWDKDWGQRGFIKIKAGEIGIDSVALSCIPDVE